MFLCYTSQGVDIVVKCLISLVVTSNHKCLNKIVSNKLALIIFESRTQHTKVVHLWHPMWDLTQSQYVYLRAQRLRKAILAAIYIYPVYVEYRRKFGVKMNIVKTPASHQGC